MRKFILFLGVAMAFVGCNKGRCVVDVKIDNLDGEGYAYITDRWDNRAIIDSAKVVNGGEMSFKLKNTSPTFAQIVMKGGRPVSHLFIEPGKVVISGDAKEDNVTLGGTVSNDAFEAMMNESQALMAEYRSAASTGDKAKMAEVEQAYDNMQTACFENNKNNAFGLFMLKQLSYSVPAVKLIDMLGQLSEELQALPYAAKLKASAERKFKTEPQVEGSDYVPHYIDIDQPNVRGENVSLKSVVENKKNRYVLLDFWASWCGPCMGEMPVLKEAYKLYHKRGFEIYGVSLDAKHAAWKGAIDKQQMGWVNVSTLERFDNPAVADYAVESIPTNYLIDCSNGVIIAKNLRGEAVLEKLAELFK